MNNKGNKMKKIISNLFILTIIVLIFSIGITASKPTSTLVVTSSNVNANDTITITVNVSDCTSASLGIIPSYDENKFELVSGEILVAGAFMSDFSDGIAVIAYTSPVTFNNSDVFRFILKAKSTITPGSYTITCEVQVEGYDVATPSVELSVPCTNHVWGEWVRTKDPTCEEKGSERHTCTVCGTTEDRDVSALGHSLSHTAAKTATCTEQGWQEYSQCSTCKQYFDANGNKINGIPYIQALGHLASAPVNENVKNATCTEAGSYDVVTYCSRCNIEMNRDHKVESALGHDYKSVVTKEPTCTEKGIRTYTCTHDNSHTYTEDIDPLGHSNAAPVKENVVPATCVSKGSYDEVVYCSRCHIELSRTHIDVPIDNDAHDWGPWVQTKAPTEYEKGQEKRTCKNDPSHTETRDIPALGHKHTMTHVAAKPATCTEGGNLAYYICSGCNRLFKDSAGLVETNLNSVTLKPLGHSPSDPVKEKIVSANCTSAGSYDEVIYCSTCHAELSRTHKTLNVDPNAHDWGEWTQTKAPTETEKGIETRICKTNPNHKETREIPELGHTHTMKSVAAKDATCTESGNKAYYICSSCNRLFTDANGKNETDINAVTIQAKGHTNSNPIKENEIIATCINEGSYDEIIKCSVCGIEISNKHVVVPVDNNAHDWGEWTQTKAPTETEKGEEQRVCKNDPSHIETREILELGHKHVLVYVPAKDPTSTETGNKGYYVCSDCNKFFEDDQGLIEILDTDSIVIPATGTEYNIISEEKLEWNENSDEKLVIDTNIPNEEFVEIKVDGKTVDPQNYIVDGETAKITLNKEFLDSLSTGEHSIMVITKNGQIDSNFSITESSNETEPKENGPQIWLIIIIVIVALAILGVVLGIIIKKKKSNNTKK